MIEADYSAALTLLLRYPAPSYPQGPPTFVGDALYLRDNILLDGGAQIIVKYSKKSPGSLSEAFTSANRSAKTKKGRRRRQRKHNDREKPNPLGISPAKFLQDQGGIEGILQEAARGVYNRGEKWGVAKALRGAVQGLQSANGSPRRLQNGLRWSLDQGNNNADDNSHMAARLHDLEQRNKALAKLLENAMEDLWVQQREFIKEKKTETAADAISLAIAKVQFVQVYLENSTMPFPTETSAEEVPEKAEPTPPRGLKVEDGSSELKTKSSAVSQQEDPFIESGGAGTTGAVLSETNSANPKPRASNNPRERPEQVSFHQPRPSLAQSSFSWMLGEDQRRSSFVSASPFPSEKRIARGKAGFLFGDDNNNPEGNRDLPHPSSKGKEEDVDEEVISLGILSSGGAG